MRIDYTALSDEELLKRFISGEKPAFERLLEKYRERVSQFIRWRLCELDCHAEDLAQEVFMDVYLKAAGFRFESSFRTWLYSVCANKCLNFRRSHFNNAGRAETSAVEEEEMLAIPDGEPCQLEALEEAERREIVGAAVEALPAHFKETLLLRDWENLSYNEIAQVLDIPAGTVRSRLHNARALLALELRRRYELP
ncbi:MAG: RNA polymerase sigma factor [Elusimicrobiales bacterium]|nr:RNA polymerase sigma factor [Elusimicrobiales bacterium]